MVKTKSSSNLSTGDEAPSFKLENYDGSKVALSDLDNFDGVLIVFMCNHCPYVKNQIQEMKKLDAEFPSIAIVGINPNCETHPEDSFEKMEDLVVEEDIDFYYLADRDQSVAESYGAECTPDPFLLDWRHRIYYKGRLNDSLSPDQEVNEREMRDIVQDMLKRRDPPADSKPSQGCSIKWREDN